MIHSAHTHVFRWSWLTLLLALAFQIAGCGQDQPMPGALIDGAALGWRALGEDDFTNINGREDTWKWEGDLIISTGEPIGVLCSKDTFANFEMVVEWRHLQSAGNSGVFAWVPDIALENLEPGILPGYGIEVQMLDHGYADQYEKERGRKGEWFTTNGDVFAVGNSKLNPFPPISPDGTRSFPRKNLSRGHGEWNHYYVRGINGEIRLWVNGEEVSGGSEADPRMGFLCLEAEGSPIEFRNLRIRELP